MIAQTVSVAANNAFSDAQTGLRAYSRSTLEVLLPLLTSDGMGISTEILMKAKEQGLKIEEVPASVLYETGERTSTKNPIGHGGEIVLSIVELVAEKRPLALIGIPGLASLCVGITFLTLVFNIFNETRQLAIGTALLSIASTLIGLLMVFGATILYSVNRWRRRIESILNHQEL